MVNWLALGLGMAGGLVVGWTGDEAACLCCRVGGGFASWISSCVKSME